MLERSFRVLDRVQRRVEVDVEGGRLAAQVLLRIARPARRRLGLHARLDVLADRRADGCRDRGRPRDRSGRCARRSRPRPPPPTRRLPRGRRRPGRHPIPCGRPPRPRPGWRFSQRASRLANSSWRCPESSRTRVASSTVPAVAWIGPRNPALTSSGSRPQWSRWAWVRTTASRSAGSKPNGIRLRTDSFGLPWNIPQSIRTRARSVSSRNCEPVTVVAPPRKWICMAAMVTVRTSGRISSPTRLVTASVAGASDGDDEGVDRDGQEQQRQVADRVPIEGDGPLGRAPPPSSHGATARTPATGRPPRGRRPRRGRSSPSAPPARGSARSRPSGACTGRSGGSSRGCP